MAIIKTYPDAGALARESALHFIECGFKHVRGESFDDRMRTAEVDDTVVDWQLEPSHEGIVPAHRVPQGAGRFVAE